MKKTGNKHKLTNKEYEILKILWASETPLTASNIVERGDALSINTVQATLKKLLKREFIRIDQIVYSGTVLSRAYLPSMSQEEFETQKYMDSMNQLYNGNFTCSHFMAAFLGQEHDRAKALQEIDELELLLEKKKQELMKKGDNNP
ncbi:BlaI/MecI/CopY family transcriptional regulator [Candidatus Merdisoma sp. JLR.KK006]|uniref:BlaI/MecI/CopY family transcriptional regulator n=1 Tax=Candidatus Merdisoma sp. JLR.KK006 TaxID=3112626 RepID=UPI002FF2B356